MRLQTNPLLRYFVLYNLRECVRSVRSICVRVYLRVNLLPLAFDLCDVTRHIWGAGEHSSQNTTHCQLAYLSPPTFSLFVLAVGGTAYWQLQGINHNKLLNAGQYTTVALCPI